MSFGRTAIGTAPYGDGTGGSDIVYYDITLVSPANNSTASDYYPTFTSLPRSSDGSVIQIEWQWDIDSTFAGSSSMAQSKTTVGNSSGLNASTTPNSALYNGPFYWRARAGNGTSWSNYTSGWTLNVPILALFSSADAYQNMGIESLTPSTDSTATAYESMGFAPVQTTQVIRQPRGWGVIPTGPQTIVILDESSAGIAEAYENIQ
jgi:hypothetical protein